MYLFALLYCTQLPDEIDDSVAADSEADADADTDTDTDTDANCAETDLLWGGSLRDTTGNCTSCASPVNIFGTVTNTCETGWVEFVTPDGCLTREVVVEIFNGGEVHRSSPGCDEVETTWRVQSGDTKQELAAESVSLSAGTYNLTITFNDSRPNHAGKVFDIQ